MWSKFITFLKGLWNVIKSMGNLKGVLALLITWLLISGSGLIGLGIILAIPRLAIIGTTIYGFWLLPLTPLIPINIGIAMLVQKYVFRDKNVSWENIKKQFAKVREKQKETEEDIDGDK